MAHETRTASPSPRRRALAAAAVLLPVAVAALADGPPLADHFGFDGVEIIRIDPNPGPLAIADIDGDGNGDIVVANNRKSRIEIHHYRPDARPDDEPRRLRVNETPENWRYRREVISVSHEIAALAVHDVDGDGLADIVYAGRPPTIVVLRQTSPGVFESHRRHTVRDLAATRDGFAIVDVVGDGEPELVALAGGRIRIWPLNRGDLGPSQDLSGGGTLGAFRIADFDGDGLLDIAGMIPDDPAPVRLWLAGGTPASKQFGAEVRFEMPAIRDAAVIQLPGEPAALLGTIERASKRIVVWEVDRQAIEAAGDREAALRVHGFRDGANRRRSGAVADIDGDGRLDFVATDVDGNAVVVHRQRLGSGIGGAESFPAYAEMTVLATGRVEPGAPEEVFVLSEREGVVGRMRWVDGGLSFPQPLAVTGGHTPVAASFVALARSAEEEALPHLAVVAKDGRNYVIDLVDLRGGTTTKIELGSQSRSPETIVALDADQDGRTDLLLFTPERPMMMLRADETGFRLFESKDMGQFGLVQAADSRNTEIHDVDGDGQPELLIADRNFVRAVRYETDAAPGASAGWQVVAQLNAVDPSTKLVSLAIRNDAVVAADRENGRLLVFERDGGEWTQRDAIDVRGFRFNAIEAGAFSGDDQTDILAVADDGFAVIRLRGERTTLRQMAAWRTDVERRRQHRMASGDVNNDGFTDLVTLDDGEQMLEILTFSAARRLLYATGFAVFESRLFAGGDAREAQPRDLFIGDVTGDRLPDIVLVAHDRLLIYPQASSPAASAAR